MNGTHWADTALEQERWSYDAARGDTASGSSTKGTRWASLMGLAALSLVGCTTVGPDFVKPEAPQTEAWVEADEPNVKSVAEDYSTWWTVFNDPILNQLVDLAYNDNLTLRVAGLRILEARASLGIAVGQQYPQVQDATGGYQRVKFSDNSPNNKSLDRNYGNLGVGLDTAWEIDFWGRFRRSIESADARLGASVADYDDLLVTLTAEVATTYVLIREFEERIALALQNVRVQQRSLEIANDRFRGGAVTELDVTQARSLLSNTQALVPFLQTLLRRAQNALSVLLGRPPSELREILGAPAKIPQAPAEVAVGIPAELLRRRPDIRAAELEAAAQSARIGVARADLFPRFTLAGFVGLNTSSAEGFASNDASLSDLFQGDSFTGFVGPSFRWPILNYGRLTNNVRVQDARFQELAVAYQDTVLRAYQEVEDSLVGFLRAREQTRFLGESVVASRRSVELSLLQYVQGTADYTRVLNTQTFLVEQEDQEAVARSAISRNLIGTYKALGGGWETRDPNASIPVEVQEEMQARTNWGDVLPAAGLEEAPTSGEEVRAKQTLIREPAW